MKNTFLSFLCLFFVSPVFAAHSYLEKEYQNHWCQINSGVTEHILPDSTRVDCLTKDYAIEFDFASKWAESIGQALYYSHCTGKKAGVVLILENPQKDQKYLDRLNAVAKTYGITVWTIKPSDLTVCKTTSKF